MKKTARFINSRIFLFFLSFIAQMIWMAVLYLYLSSWFTWLDTTIRILTVLVVLVIVNKRYNASYRLAWTLLILTLPIFGVCFYLLYGNSRLKLRLKKEFSDIQKIGSDILRENENVRSSLEENSREASLESVYLKKMTGFPVYANEGAKYYSVGDDVLPDMLEAMEKAEQYIFLEFFIIAPGYFWESVHDILRRKAAEGVDVRLIYDDFGCASTLPYHYYKKLQAEGIKCACFNQLHFVVSIVMNNRDHRKILVVDGNTAFTGGFNIADEYINQKEHFGHWKDAGIRINGSPAWSFASMFLQMWEVAARTKEDPSKYTPLRFVPPVEKIRDGFVHPYSDMPFNDEAIGENLYLQLISNARQYVWIFTPYLVLTDEMMTILTIAARRGVDVRIVTPHIPDKKLVFLVTQSNYPQLMEAGVRIWEYTPGFLHSKVMVSDDRNAVVGSFNLDYRSLYLQYEDAVWIHDASVIKDIRQDLADTFDVSGEISYRWVCHRPIILRAFMSFLRVFSPLM